MGASPKLPQWGGEGTESYKKSSDMGLPQHGGEGTDIGKKNDMKLRGSNRPQVSGSKLTNT
jgi:hypothetical protein